MDVRTRDEVRCTVQDAVFALLMLIGLLAVFLLRKHGRWGRLPPLSRWNASAAAEASALAGAGARR
jgi:hypothetical protein